MGHNINIIIPLCCHLLVFCNCKQQIQSPYQLPYIKKAMNFQDEATKLLHEQHLKLLYVNIIKNLPKGIHKFTWQLTELNLKIKSVAYSSQGSHTGQLDFCNWLADSSTMG